MLTMKLKVTVTSGAYAEIKKELPKPIVIYGITFGYSTLENTAADLYQWHLNVNSQSAFVDNNKNTTTFAAQLLSGTTNLIMPIHYELQGLEFNKKFIYFGSDAANIATGDAYCIIFYKYLNKKLESEP